MLTLIGLLIQAIPSEERATPIARVVTILAEAAATPSHVSPEQEEVNTPRIPLPADPYGLAAMRGPSKGKAMKRETDAAGEESQDSGTDHIA